MRCYPMGGHRFTLYRIPMEFPWFCNDSPRGISIMHPPVRLKCILKYGLNAWVTPQTPPDHLLFTKKLLPRWTWAQEAFDNLSLIAQFESGLQLVDLFSSNLDFPAQWSSLYFCDRLILVCVLGINICPFCTWFSVSFNRWSSACENCFKFVFLCFIL